MTSFETKASGALFDHFAISGWGHITDNQLIDVPLKEELFLMFHVADVRNDRKPADEQNRWTNVITLFFGDFVGIATIANEQGVYNWNVGVRFEGNKERGLKVFAETILH